MGPIPIAQSSGSNFSFFAPPHTKHWEVVWQQVNWIPTITLLFWQHITAVTTELLEWPPETSASQGTTWSMAETLLKRKPIGKSVIMQWPSQPSGLIGSEKNSQNSCGVSYDLLQLFFSRQGPLRLDKWKTSNHNLLFQYWECRRSVVVACATLMTVLAWATACREVDCIWTGVNAAGDFNFHALSFHFQLIWDMS